MDLISRLAAIDICNNAIDLWNGQIGCGALVAVKDRISGLPSAEPEIIRCEDCRHNRSCEIQYHAQAGDLFYCGAAERGTDE